MFLQHLIQGPAQNNPSINSNWSHIWAPPDSVSLCHSTGTFKGRAHGPLSLVLCNKSHPNSTDLTSGGVSRQVNRLPHSPVLPTRPCRSSGPRGATGADSDPSPAAVETEWLWRGAQPGSHPVLPGILTSHQTPTPSPEAPNMDRS